MPYFYVFLVLLYCFYLTDESEVLEVKHVDHFKTKHFLRKTLHTGSGQSACMYAYFTTVLELTNQT